jgi:hypothetical protein
LIFGKGDILMRHILKKIVKKVKKLVKMIIKEVENYMNKEKELIETKAEIVNDFMHDDEMMIKGGTVAIASGLGIILIGIGMVSSVVLNRKIVLA